MSKKKSDLLKSEVEKQEKEFELIKEFLERKNGSQKSSEIFGKLNLNFDVSGRKTSAKIPKKLNQKEKEKREFFRRMKEVDELGNLQAKLFKQVGNRRKIEPINKKLSERGGLLSNNKDYFGENLNKEFNKLFEGHNDKVKKEMVENNKEKNDNKITVKNNKINHLHNKKESIVVKSTSIKSPKTLLSTSNISSNNIINNASNISVKNQSKSPKSSSKNRTLSSVLPETKAQITQEELITGPDFDLEKIERKRAEEFGKAVDRFRGGGKKDAENNKEKCGDVNKGEYKEESTSMVYDKQPDFTNKSVVLETNNICISDDFNSVILLSEKDMVCCWNCMRKISRKSATVKNYENLSQISFYNKTKYFCGEKCVKEFEREKFTKIICFQCTKFFNVNDGFVMKDGQKFCSVKCKTQFIEEENRIGKAGKNFDKKETKNVDEINKGNSCDEDEAEIYDPMDEF